MAQQERESYPICRIAGIVTGNTTIQDRAKRWFREWVTFANFADSTIQNLCRWESSYDLHWTGAYAGRPSLRRWRRFADAFARTGDTSAFHLQHISRYSAAT